MRLTTEIRALAQKAYPALTESPDPAPQGQNGFSGNLLLQDGQGAKFLVKVIRLAGTDLDDPAVAVEEIQASAAVRSQYFVRLIDTHTTGGYAFLRFPFLQGENLADYLARNNGTLQEVEIKEIGIALLRGVADMSRKGIHHQDIKPENIFMTKDGSVKILDFGSARFKKKSFRGTTKTNKSHSSPEQLLASRPGYLEAMRLTADERGDVYAVGSVLHLLATGDTPFPTNEAKVLGNPPEAIERDDISDGLKRIIGRMLNLNPHNRPMADVAASYIQAGDVQPIEVARGGFYYAASNSLKVIQDLYALDKTLVSGITITASKIPATDEEYLRNGPLLTIIDPEAYKFQVPAMIKDNKKFKNLPYFGFGKNGDSIGVEHITDDDGFINAVFDFEISAGADMLLPPFLFVKEFNDNSWTRNAELTARAFEIYKERDGQLPMLRGIAIADNVLESSTSRGRLIDQITTTDSFDDTAGYYVLLECTQREGLPNENWLKAAKDLVLKLLATGKPVIWGNANLPAIVFAHSGVGLAMGEGQTQRCFTLNEVPTRGGPSSPHLYLPKIFARIKWPGGYQVLRTQGYNRVDELACTDNCCTDIDFTNPPEREKANLSLHLVHQLALQFKKYSPAGGSAKERKDLEFAKRVYTELRGSNNPLLREAVRKELKPDSGAFLDNWLNAFHSG